MSTPVTPHFSVEEFDCHDGTPYPRDRVEACLRPLCDTLEVIRDEAGGDAMFVDSGFRTVEYDRRLYDAHIAALIAKGLPNDHLVAEPTSSQHPEGTAADMKHSKLNPVALFNLILKLFAAGKLPHLGGVGLYPNFVHVDVRARPDSTGGANDGHLAIWGGSRPSNIA